MKLFRLAIFLLLVLVIVLALTNPGEKAHKAVYYQSLPGDAGMRGVWSDLAGDVLQRVDAIPLQYNNYLLFSTLTRRDRTVTFGIFNSVWDTSPQHRE